jgi:hypothetical protein
MKIWFYRLTAVHFIVTALTGLALYFRPGGNRPGLYSEELKEWLVMIHNGEWLSHLIFERPFYSGMLIGVLLSLVLVKFSAAALQRPRTSRTV